MAHGKFGKEVSEAAKVKTSGRDFGKATSTAAKAKSADKNEGKISRDFRTSRSVARKQKSRGNPKFGSVARKAMTKGKMGRY